MGVLIFNPNYKWVFDFYDTFYVLTIVGIIEYYILFLILIAIIHFLKKSLK